MNLNELFSSWVNGLKGLVVTYAGVSITMWDLFIFGCLVGLVGLVIRGLMAD